MASSISLIFLISLPFLFLSPSFSAKITLSLSSSPHHSSDPLRTVASLASASLSRAHTLKIPKYNINSTSSSSFSDSKSLTKTPLYPRSYGGYSVSLRFGTPPQTVDFVMDTGSSLVWFPCTSRYLCSKCSFPSSDKIPLKIFIPKLSSSSKLIGCNNPKCQLALGYAAKCEDSAQKNPKNPSACPPYVIQYGSGSTIGRLLSENLDFPNKIVPNFIVGCSILSLRQPSGIAGFGRGKESLPSQLRLSKFSYCLVSHRFDDSSVSSDLILYSNDDKEQEASISYTPFQKSPSIRSSRAFKEFYYVLLRKVIVGAKHLKIPYRYLVPGSDGNGGTIVDSGSTFTFMERPMYDAVSGEFARQMANYTRAKGIEKLTGLSPCFDIAKEKTVNFPELVLQFKGGAKMELPLPNYFSLVGDPGLMCLTVVTNNDAGGPAIILGNYLQQNFHIEFDLKNERFGFRRQTCK